jgi:hypothetical protein
MTTPKSRDQLEAIARAGGLGLGKLIEAVQGHASDDLASADIQMSWVRKRQHDPAVAKALYERAADLKLAAEALTELETLRATLSSKDAEITRLREAVERISRARVIAFPTEAVPVGPNVAMASETVDIARAALTNPEQAGE